APVAGSRASTPVRTPSTRAASVTVRPNVPTVSWLCAIGTTPARLVRPTVGLIPTTPLAPEGATTEPFVSVPRAAAARLAATATAEPELDPEGFRFRTLGLRVWPPRPLHALVEWVDRKLAHSLRFVFPRITAPPSRSRFATVASCAGGAPTSASDPAV